ncbi:Zinc finger, CCCH-type [Corchorus olitorius]|uniref:Zinc finger, CCCH-type n=1 Tax=Corchorus olitorius TaxID=93759 RepID=A0A1R3HFP5_9ROSI|nr:Zinc finger, CCCH-type [Corchorus olitorius]
MGSCEEYSSLPETHDQNLTQTESGSGFNSKTLFSNLNPGSEKEEESLVEGLKNLALEDNEWNGYGEDNNSQNLGVEWQNGDSFHHPLRAYAEDCSFFVKTGNCKFGSNCRFNHPVERGFQDKENGWTAEQTSKIECKFVLSLLPLLFNFVGSSKVWGGFNHPDPSAAEGSNSCSSVFSGFGGHSSGNYNGGSNPLPSLSTSKPIGASSSLNRMSDKHVPYLDHNSSYAYGTHLNSEWNGSQEKTFHPYVAPSVPNAVKTGDISELHQGQIQVGEFPERAGEPECPYFMKTGYCKYKAACKFHHPKTRSSQPPAVMLSRAGLPLRPDRKICWNYEKFGICKYGGNCLFHHPENLF